MKPTVVATYAPLPTKIESLAPTTTEVREGEEGAVGNKKKGPRVVEPAPRPNDAEPTEQPSQQEARNPKDASAAGTSEGPIQ